MKNVIAGLEEGLQAIAEALEGSSGPDIPTPAAADEGKVLTADDDGTVSWEDIHALPSTEGAARGDVLLLDGYKIPFWGEPSGLVPSTSGASEGDVLTVNEYGSPAWATPSGGGGSGTTIYKKASTVQYNDKSDNYYVSIETLNTPITTNTVLLAVYNTDSQYSQKPVFTGYEVSTGMDYLEVIFDSNPNFTNALLVFATPESAS